MAEEFDSTDTIDEGELLQKDAEVAALQDKLTDLQTTTNQLKDNNGVCQQDIVALEAHYPEIITKRLPTASFTKDPSKTNYAQVVKQLEVSMEEISVAMIAFIAYIVILCIRIIAVLIHNHGVQKNNEEVEKRKEEYRKTAEEMRRFWQDETKYDAKIAQHFADSEASGVPESFLQMMHSQGMGVKSAKDGFIILDKINTERLHAFMEQHYNALINDVLTGGPLSIAVGECVVGINASINSVITSTEEILKITSSPIGGRYQGIQPVTYQIIEILSKICKKANISVEIKDSDSLLTGVEAIKQFIAKAQETVVTNTKFTAPQAIGKAYVAHKQFSAHVDDGLDRKFKQMKANIDRIERQNKEHKIFKDDTMRNLKDIVRVYASILMLAKNLQTRIEGFYKAYTHIEKQHRHEEIQMGKILSKISDDIKAKGIIINLNKQYDDTWSSDLLGLPHKAA